MSCFMKKILSEDIGRCGGLSPVKATDAMTQPVGQKNGQLFTEPGTSDLDPVAKTDEMTQPVGKAADGKLYTKPAADPVDPPVTSVNGKTGAVTITGAELITDLTTIRSGAASGATAVQPAALTAEATARSDADTALSGRVSAIEAKESGWDAKQSAITDLATIRSGAASGATAVQPAALTVEATARSDADTALSGRVSAIEAKESGWDAKQSAITDLATIRSGAAAGATAVQPAALNTYLSKTPLPAATDAQTEAVGLGTDGKLYTRPGGGGGGGFGEHHIYVGATVYPDDESGDEGSADICVTAVMTGTSPLTSYGMFRAYVRTAGMDYHFMQATGIVYFDDVTYPIWALFYDEDNSRVGIKVVSDSAPDFWFNAADVEDKVISNT